MRQTYEDLQLTAWKSEVLKAIEDKESLRTVKHRIELLLNDKGIPQTIRPIIWKKLVGNQLRINKPLFSMLMEQATQTFKEDCLIKKDIDRTFFYFTKSEEFTKILAESTLLLEMFTLYRPDIKYIQGMSYVITMLLLHYRPYSAFKMFCNLVLTKEFLYKTYIFKTSYIDSINKILEYMVSKNYSRLYDYLRRNKLELWNIFWIEWVYAMFLRTFDLKTCLKLWDFMLLKGDTFVFKLNSVVFGILDEKFDQIDKDNFFESAKRIILANQEKIVSRSYHSTNDEFEMMYIKKLIKKT